MDLNYSPEELAFRDEVRSWLAANLPADLREKGEDGACEDHSTGSSGSTAGRFASAPTGRTWAGM